MQRLLLAAAAVALVFVGGCLVRRALASPETKIRWRIESMAEGFDEGHVGKSIGPLAPDWRDAGGRVDRETLARGLAGFFWQERDAQTKRLVYSVELDEGDPRVTVEPDGERARAEVVATFLRRTGDEVEIAWKLAIEATLERRDGEWVIVHTAREDLEGKSLRMR